MRNCAGLTDKTSPNKTEKKEKRNRNRKTKKKAQTAHIWRDHADTLSLYSNRSHDSVGCIRKSLFLSLSRMCLGSGFCTVNPRTRSKGLSTGSAGILGARFFTILLSTSACLNDKRRSLLIRQFFLYSLCYDFASPSVSQGVVRGVIHS